MEWRIIGSVGLSDGYRRCHLRWPRPDSRQSEPCDLEVQNLRDSIYLDVGTLKNRVRHSKHRRDNFFRQFPSEASERSALIAF
jgi:hypothetical protein